MEYTIKCSPSSLVRPNQINQHFRDCSVEGIQKRKYETSVVDFTTPLLLPTCFKF